MVQNTPMTLWLTKLWRRWIGKVLQCAMYVPSYLILKSISLTSACNLKGTYCYMIPLFLIFVIHFFTRFDRSHITTWQLNNIGLHWYCLKPNNFNEQFLLLASQGQFLAQKGNLVTLLLDCKKQWRQLSH